MLLLLSNLLTTLFFQNYGRIIWFHYSSRIPCGICGGNVLARNENSWLLLVAIFFLILSLVISKSSTKIRPCPFAIAASEAGRPLLFTAAYGIALQSTDTNQQTFTQPVIQLLSSFLHRRGETATAQTSCEGSPQGPLVAI